MYSATLPHFGGAHGDDNDFDTTAGEVIVRRGALNVAAAAAAAAVERLHIE